VFHVKQDLSIPELVSFLKKEEIVLTKVQIERLNLFYNELLSWSKKMNLISKGDAKYLVERHFLTSFYYIYHIIKSKTLTHPRILDLGTGAGFPGVIISIFLDGAKIVLLDSSRKKYLFLKQLVTKLDIQASVVCERAEKLRNKASDKFDIIVARAVAPIPELVKLAFPLLMNGGSLYTLKGINYKEELKKNDTEIAKITEFDIVKSWTEFSSYLKNKRILKLEHIHA